MSRRRRVHLPEEPGYAVGYGRPPKHSRFRKGESGNPKGRPSGRKDLASILAEVLHRKVIVTEKGRSRKVTAVEAVLLGLLQKSLGGDPRAIDKLMKLLPMMDADPWTCLEQASEGYLTTMLTNSTDASLIITEFPRRRSSKLRNKLIADRQRFEDIFREIVEELPLAPEVDRTYWRLALLGMLAWTYVWYDTSGDPPSTVARHLIALLKNKTAA